MLERILGWLLWPVAVLFVGSVVMEGVGITPFAAWLPGQLTASTVLAIALLGVLLARVEGIEGRVTEAMKHFSPAEETLRQTLARVDAVTGEAKVLSAELERLREKIAQSDVLLPGRLALMQKRFDQAAELFEEVLERGADNREAKWLLGVALFRSRKAREALPYLKAALVDTDPDQLQLLAQCEHFLGHHREAEAHALRAIDIRRPAPQELVALLGSIQGELDPDRARATLKEALGVYPRSSPIRHELVKLEIDTSNYDAAIDIATEGVRLNDRDAGALIDRAEARLRRGREDDEPDVLNDLDQAERLHRRDANLYRQRGELYLRQASRATDSAERQRLLREAIGAYDAGIANIKPGWLQAALLTSKSRVLLFLDDYDGGAAAAKAAVEVQPGHVSNHIALALARLAAGKWQPAVIAADAGQNVGGWAGRVILTAVKVIGLAMAGVDPEDLAPHCRNMAEELERGAGKFTPSEAWAVVKNSVLTRAPTLGGSGGDLITDTVRLLDSQMPIAQFRAKWTVSKPAGV